MNQEAARYGSPGSNLSKPLVRQGYVPKGSGSPCPEIRPTASLRLRPLSPDHVRYLHPYLDYLLCEVHNYLNYVNETQTLFGPCFLYLIEKGRSYPGLPHCASFCSRLDAGI